MEDGSISINNYVLGHRKAVSKIFGNGGKSQIRPQPISFPRSSKIILSYLQQSNKSEKTINMGRAFYFSLIQIDGIQYT